MLKRSTIHTDLLGPSLCPALAGSRGMDESDPISALLLALGVRGWGREDKSGKEGLCSGGSRLLKLPRDPSNQAG